AVVRKYREAHNQNNLAALDAIVAQDVISHAALPGLPSGLAGGKMAHQIFLGTFSDLQTTTEDLIADGDRVVERYTGRGTHTGEFMGAPPTGKKFEAESIVIYRLTNGKIVETWGLNDVQAVMTQLGLMPNPA
ncbi:MAG: ester cyclase, partial [Chloroflexi bacterium]|nr:ester cyclase [Chloroflexota bacterium]